MELLERPRTAAAHDEPVRLRAAGVDLIDIKREELAERMFLPMYREYIEIAHSHGKKIFMHSDGYILDILPRLVDVCEAAAPFVHILAPGVTAAHCLRGLGQRIWNASDIVRATATSCRS